MLGFLFNTEIAEGAERLLGFFGLSAFWVLGVKN